jgi:transposase InsO family protein
VKFRLVQAEKAHFPIELMCRVLEVSRSGYYAWVKRAESKRERENRRLKVEVSAAFEENKRRYGSPRIKRVLASRGVAAGRHRIARLMKEAGLRARPKRRFVVTTNSRHGRSVAPNLVQRQFKPKAANQLWASDLTYIATREGWLYLTVVLDLYSRRVVGWSVDETMEARCTARALQHALDARKPAAGLVFHSDRGVQYASAEVTSMLSQHGLVPSMSRAGNCWDNAVVESFFSTLKTELGDSFPSRESARYALFEYLNVFYNRRRLHSTLGYLSPQQYEEKAA